MTASMATWWHPLGFALFGGMALLLGVLRHRGAWPLARRAAINADSTDAPRCGPPSIWHARVLQAVDARRFKMLCEAMFRQDGCSTGPMAIPGDDFVLQRPDDVPPRRRLVRCHAGSAWPSVEPALRAFAGAGEGVGAGARAMAGAMAAAPADSGIFIAAGPVDAAAIAFARQQSITLVDGPSLLKLIVQRSTRQQRALREIATPPAAAHPSRFALAPTPAPAWFAMAGAGMLAAWVSWPAPRAAVSLPAEAGEPARLAATSASRRRAEEEPARVRPPHPDPATNADLDAPPVAAATPAAGRQVLRCTDAGRVTYLPAGATCASGHGERITVFPTEGVNPFR